MRVHKFSLDIADQVFINKDEPTKVAIQKDIDSLLIRAKKKYPNARIEVSEFLRKMDSNTWQLIVYCYEK